jgi:hypothetical protein
MFMQLVIPVLYLASLTQRSSFGDLADDVFTFTRERYFIGETVEVNTTEDTWYVHLLLWMFFVLLLCCVYLFVISLATCYRCKSHVLQVIPPTEKEIAKHLSRNG